MAKEVSISARVTPESADLASWLTRELRVVRPSSPPVQSEASSLSPPRSLDEATSAPPATATSVFATPAVAMAAAVENAVATPATEAIPQEEPSATAGVPVPEPVAVAAPVTQEEIPAPPEPELDEPRDGTAGLYGATGADWSSDDDAFFASSPDAGTASDGDEIEDGPLLAEGTIGASLSPQVLESEEGDVDAPLAVPGTGGKPYFKIAAGVAAALLLLAFFVRHKSPATHTETAAQALQPAALEAPPPPSGAAPRDEITAEAVDVKARGSSKGGGFSDFGGKHAPPADTRDDPFIPGGPSVARFPDLPRDILNALEQAFEAGEGKKDSNKARGDATGGY